MFCSLVTLLCASQRNTKTITRCANVGVFGRPATFRSSSHGTASCQFVWISTTSGNILIYNFQPSCSCAPMKVPILKSLQNLAVSWTSGSLKTVITWTKPTISQASLASTSKSSSLVKSRFGVLHKKSFCGIFKAALLRNLVNNDPKALPSWKSGANFRFVYLANTWRSLKEILLN